MSTAFGYGVKVGFGKEAAYGQVAVPALYAWLTADGENLSLKQSRKVKPTLGNLSQSFSTRSKADVTGNLKLYGTHTGLEFLLEQAIGHRASAAGQNGQYVHTFSLAKTQPFYLTTTVDRDSADAGSAVAYPGGSNQKLTLEQKLEEPLIITADMVGNGQEIEAAAVVPANLPALTAFDWEDLTVTLGGAPLITKDFSLTIENSLETDRYKMGSRNRIGLGRKDVLKISGKLETELDADTYNSIVKTYRSLDFLELVATWANGNDSLVITLPRITPSGDTPHAKNAEVIKLTMPFEAFATLGGQFDEMSVVLTNSNQLQ